MKEYVLDKGFIGAVDSLGTDLTVVNSARVSFGKRKRVLDEDDCRLMGYLAKNKHYSPFRHIMLQLHIKAPEVVMRQWYKHVVGAETTSAYPTKDHAWNEISGRYTEVDEFYYPTEWRRQSEDNKQASEGQTDAQDHKHMVYATALEHLQEAYEALMAEGVAREQARMLLPLSLYTEVYWTASFQAIMNFIELRDDPHAQWEIREYAKALKRITYAHFPNATKQWLDNSK